MAGLEFTPCDGVGAEVSGVDLTRNLSADVVSRLRRGLGTYGVLFFRDQTLTPAAHIALAERFGPIVTNRFFRAVQGYPMIAEVRKEPDQSANIGGGWHTDHSYDERPALGSILVAREVPQSGGDTLFANMYAAHDGLSDGLKQTLRSLRAVHSSRHIFGAGQALSKGDLDERLGNAGAASQDAVHPAIITHPLSGRRALYVNPTFTVRFDGWTRAESKPLLDMLYAHAIQPAFVHRFAWRPGSVAFWDNRATWHFALNDYHGHRRVMHRITIDGELLFP